MFNKRLIILLLAASVMASCDRNDIPVPADPEVVGFDVYVSRGVTTKAGWGGTLDTDALKNAGKADGFGVFAYYGNGALYNETSKPDFMYNQKVTHNGTAWTYSPVKYWPNEFGAAASSEAADRLSFFAYAPYAAVTPSTGVVTGDGTSGIIGMSRNITAGDPVVMYSANLTPGEGVDLCWGVAKEAFTSSVDGNNNDVQAGSPYIDVLKTKTGDHITFEFNHALAQLNVKVDAVSDAALDANTRIFVRSITFNGFSMRGSLNLNSNKTDGAIWYDISGTGRLKREAVTIYDGRTDGMEGVATATDPGEKPFGLNHVIVQSKPYGDADLSTGVTATAVNLFESTGATADAPVLVIPTPGVPLSVTIVYDVETVDNRLADYLSDGVTHGSSVENKITKTITTNQGNMLLSAGKKYVVNLHLGLTGVKFDADALAWSTDDSNTGNVNLPDNPDTTPGTSAASFRGYEVSKGLLERTVVSSEASYSLTAGDNQFEILDYYGVDENKGKYYHQWTKLLEELGSDADGNINASSNKLPNGWTMPGSADWGAIVFGDATGITINGQAVSYGYALTTVTVGTLAVPSLMLVPDGASISLSSLSGLESYFNVKSGDYGFDKINLSEDDRNSLISNECRFIPVSGQYWSTEWRDGINSYYPTGYYWVSNHYTSNPNQPCFLSIDPYLDSVSIPHTTGLNDYYPVRLVKKID